MAIGTQVPWTTPGGTPCCCIAECPQQTIGYSTATRHTISADDYSSLYAGGTMRISYTGSASATSESIFGGGGVCSTGSSFSRIDDVICAPNFCQAQVTSVVTISSEGSTFAPSYSHVLESAGQNYSVMFGIATAGSSLTKCGTFAGAPQTGARASNIVYNDGPPPPAGQLNFATDIGLLTVQTSSIQVTLPYSTLSVPSYVVGVSTYYFFRRYTSLSATNDVTCVWTPLPP